MTVTTDRRQGVDSSAAIKVACRVTTTANITLSGEQTIDGVAVVTDDRVLVKDQTTASENGIYIADTSGWTRSPDWDGSLDVQEGTLIFVTSGTNNGWWYVSTSSPIVVGTTSVTIAQTSTELAIVSAYIQTLLNDVDAATARATLGAEYGNVNYIVADNENHIIAMEVFS